MEESRKAFNRRSFATLHKKGILYRSRAQKAPARGVGL